MGYETQTWTPGSSPLSSSRMTHIEDGIEAADPIGSIAAFPWVEPGWLALDGSEVSRSQYQDLFDKANANGQVGAGKFFGPGDGSTTFDLPDFRDRFPRGTPAGGDPGTTGGSESHSHASGGSTGAAGGHSHSQPSTGSAGSHSHSNPTTGSAGSHRHNADHGHSNIQSAGAHTHSFSDSFITGGPSSTNPLNATGVDLAAGGSHTHSGSVSGTTGSAGGHTHDLPSGSVLTDFDGSHSHTQGSTGSGGSHSHSNPNTDSVSNHSHSTPAPAATTNRPPFIDVIWQIRT